MREIAQARMVALVRDAKGWTQSKLAAVAGVNQALISKVESGLMDMRSEDLTRVAAALDCPEELLTNETPVPSLEVTCLHHRRRSSTMTVGAKKRIEAVAHLSRISVEGLLQGFELEPQVSLTRIPLDEGVDPADIARKVRMLWNVSNGPITNLVRLVESSGVILIIRQLGSVGQDAVSTWPHDIARPPMMIINSGLAPDRQRFTIAHELGHLVMHSIPGDDQEQQANSFAGEFLAPASEIHQELVGLTTGDFRQLLELKMKWGLSISALIRRAFDLGLISDRQYREFQVRLGKLGWRSSEPGNLPNETPTSITRVIQLRRNELDHSIAELAQVARMTEAAFRRHYLRPDSAPGQRTKLKLVMSDE